MSEHAPKIKALKELAKMMAKLDLDRISGFKKESKDATELPEEDVFGEESEEELDPLAALADEEEEEEEEEDPKLMFKKVLEARAKKI